MDLLVAILKGLVVLGVNIGFGYLITYSFHFFLFYPRKICLFGKYPLKFTPGLLFRKKKQLIDYLKKIMADYYDYVSRDYFDKNLLTEYENKIYNEIFPHIKKFVTKEWLPSFISDRINNLLSDLTWMIIYQLSRNILPQILREVQVERKIDILDMKMDIFKVREYFEEYVYKYLLYFNLTFFAVVGVINMIVFWILA